MNFAPPSRRQYSKFKIILKGLPTLEEDCSWEYLPKIVECNLSRQKLYLESVCQKISRFSFIKMLSSQFLKSLHSTQVLNHFQGATNLS